MNCPLCSVDLVMSDRQGIEIDYCPKCRGVWLDRGELDKILERSAQEASPRQNRENEYSHQDKKHHSDDHHEKHGKDHSYKKRSFLLDLFD
jgi:Zn-finger nucleic acid-binding protein